jgi:hypothetical protein
MTNLLAHEKSLYLRQHAGNPVHWQPWTDAVWQAAARSGRLVVVSIGYSSCHWCHVMEHESFEDAEVAEVMNRHFISVKVDREERPDIDQVYMAAVQLMTGQGGWPLNCVLLPDGRPVYGGTYFRKADWLRVLNRLAELWENDRDRMLAYAGELEEGMKASQLVSAEPGQGWQLEMIGQLLQHWRGRMDTTEGGMNRAPKFPMPDNYRFLLRCAVAMNDRPLMDYVLLTAGKMYMGGIRDQVGGGFFRYSTDALWKVPHFEKMLYDNAQLLVFYSELYVHHPQPWVKECIAETAAYLLDDCLLPGGVFAASRDADSEGEEGLFYTWESEALDTFVEPDEVRLAAEYFNFNQHGHWEGRYIPLRRGAVTAMPPEMTNIRLKMAAQRAKRVAPVRDDKVITGWNALAITGLCEAWKAVGDVRYLNAAADAAAFICRHLMVDGTLYRIWNGTGPAVPAFLDDVALLGEALLNLAMITGDDTHYRLAVQLAEQALARFESETGVWCYYTPADAGTMVMRPVETEDNVMPSSNSVLAGLLYRLGAIQGNVAWMDRAERMLDATAGSAVKYGSAYARWGMLAMLRVEGLREVAVTGPGAVDAARALWRNGVEQAVIIASETESDIPLLAGRNGNRLRFFVCRNHACAAPVETVEETLKLLNT